jgi:hypothetical protein
MPLGRLSCGSRRFWAFTGKGRLIHEKASCGSYDNRTPGPGLHAGDLEQQAFRTSGRWRRSRWPRRDRNEAQRSGCHERKRPASASQPRRYEGKGKRAEVSFCWASSGCQALQNTRPATDPPVGSQIFVENTPRCRSSYYNLGSVTAEFREREETASVNPPGHGYPEIFVWQPLERMD